MLTQILKYMIRPLGWPYWLVTAIRNWMFDNGHLPSTKFDVPTICVGNLSVGGTGKTPHVEYLIRLLQQEANICTLSRGYRRKTTGFRMANFQSTAEEIGDEPTIYKKKYPNINVAVGERRVLAIPELLSVAPQTNLIILDDAFQHRSLQADLNILITDFADPYYQDYLLPAGRLRESAKGAERADIIIVSKCPTHLTKEQQAEIKAQIHPSPYQKLFFTSYRYGRLYTFLSPTQFINDVSEAELLLVTGIANPKPLRNYLEEKSSGIHQLTFKDHHNFDRYDLENIREAYINMQKDGRQVYIVTTEKDATRLAQFYDWMQQNDLPVLIQPIEVVFHRTSTQTFDDCLHFFRQQMLN